MLEDLVRVLEDRQAAVAELADDDREHGGRDCKSMRTVVEQVLPRLIDHPATNGTADERTPGHRRGRRSTAATDALIADVKARLAEWHAAAGASQDCPLPGPVPQARIGRRP